LRERRRRAQETATTSPGADLWGHDPWIAAAAVSGQKLNSPFFEIVRVLVRLDHVASFIVNTNHSIMPGQRFVASFC
jgi:hypothetical protein